MRSTRPPLGVRRAVYSTLLLLVLAACRDDSGSPTGPDAAPLAAPAELVAGTPVQVARGGHHSCLVASTGRAWCWGDNSQGQLGTGATGSTTVPVRVAGDLRFTHLSLGWLHSCGVTTEKRVYCWGFNFDGQLGDGTGYPTNIRRLTPVQVAGSRRYRQVRAGRDFTCAITTADVAFCWGLNTFGQLGTGTGGKSPSPVRVVGGHEWRQLNAGEEHVCGVTRDDRAFCWGMGFWGQLGHGTEEARSRPTAVAGGLRFRQVTAGGKHSCGITTQDKAYCWGDNNDGQLGDGTAWPPVLKRLTPVAVATSRRFDHVVAGSDHTCGVALSSRAFCWGLNTDGQLGDGTTTRRLTPVPILGGFGVDQLGAMGLGSVALTNDGRLFQWGSGQSTPTLVPGL